MFNFKTNTVKPRAGQLRRWFSDHNVPDWDRGVLFTVLEHREGDFAPTLRGDDREPMWSYLQGDVVRRQAAVTIERASEVVDG